MFGGQSLPTPTRPADLTRRIPDNNSMVRHGPRHHSARSDKSVAPDVVPAHNHALSAQGRPTADTSLQIVFPITLPRELTAGNAHIGEGHRRPAKNVVLQNNAIVHVDVVLELAMAPHNGTVVDIDVLADIARLTHNGPRAHAGIGPHLGIWPYAGSRIDHCPLMNEAVMSLAGHVVTHLASPFPMLRTVEHNVAPN